MTIIDTPYYVEIKADSIAIYDVGANEEVLYWSRDEWIEDPDLIVPIANAIRMAIEQPLKFAGKVAELKAALKTKESS